MSQPIWTHIVTADDGHNYYCYLSPDRNKLLAIGDDVKAPGQVVCLWDDDKEEWFLRNDPEARIYVRWKQAPERVRKPQPHTVVYWRRWLRDGGDDKRLLPVLFVGGSPAKDRQGRWKLCWPKVHHAE